MLLNQCILYAAGLYLTFAFDDLSLKAAASQSPIIITDQQLKYKASNALDKNTDTCMRTNDIGPTAVHKATWWKVDLGGLYSIYSINILFKNYGNLLEYRQRGRFAGFSLYVSNTDISNISKIHDATLCYKDGPQLPPLNFTTTCTKCGRYVIFYNERRNNVDYPEGYQLSNMYTELCEVAVNGCKDLRVYGTKCDVPCPVNCKNNTCHILSGTCLECEHGQYGSFCNISCPINCKDNTCKISNGTCFTCKAGWIGMYCGSKCGEGWYGVNCSHQCPGQCKNAATCNHVTGQCDVGCKEGWYNVYCSQQCSGHCKDNNNCNHSTGQCDKGCDAGWTGAKCEKECDDGTFGYECNNKCRGHCLNNYPCNKQTGQCDGGCNTGYTDDECGKVCADGQFGMNCSNHCTGHCENNEPCDHVSGVCPGGCQDGFTDQYCNSSCEVGKFGKNCSLPCPQGCNGTCNHIDGSCANCKERLEGHCPKGNDPSIAETLFRSSNNLSVTIGATVGTCLVFTVGVVIIIFILRLKRKATMLKKRESIILEVKPSIKTRQIMDHKPHDNKAHGNDDSTYVLPEKTKRGPHFRQDIPRGELHLCTEAKKLSLSL